MEFYNIAYNILNHCWKLKAFRTEHLITKTVYYTKGKDEDLHLRIDSRFRVNKINFAYS